jgi:hypothetical protein
LKDFYQATLVDEKNIIYKKYINFINQENIPNQLKKVYNMCKRIQKTYEINDKVVVLSFAAYNHTLLDIEVNDKITNECACGAAYYIETKTSESVCHKCGSIEKLYGMVFEDEQLFRQEGQRTRHGKYDPTKHCKFWVDRIQAKETTEIPDQIINRIKQRILRDNVWIERLSCNDIRGYLKEIGETDYNSHVSLIKKLITKIEPPQFTDHELKLIYMYFSRVIQIHNRNKSDDNSNSSSNSNSPYHPFFVYKIVEQILSENIHKTRRNEILSSIHLQSRDTLIKNDRIWQEMCEEITDFTYIPTYPIE